MLTTTNYKMKTTNETLSIAYAKLDKLNTNKNNVVAIFGIYATKEEANRYNSVETKGITFEWDRKSNLAEQAYNIAKGLNGVLFGWIDDIV